MERVEINCEGLVCPLPIITLKRRLKELAQGTPMTIIVDNSTAAGNVTAFLKDLGVSVQFTPHQASTTLLSATFDNPGVEALDPTLEANHAKAICSPTTAPTVDHRAMTTILCATDTLGQGAEELGKVLIKGFFSTLTGWDPVPKQILLINRGVMLTLDDSPTLSVLETLAEAGTEISICGTCVDYYGVRERIAVGSVVNMLVISTALSQAEKVVRL